MPDREKVGYLGPPGTWAEEALRASTGLSPDETVPLPSVYDVITAVADGRVAQGLVPIENSLEGSVSATLDVLAFEAENVLIVREIIHPVRHRLIARQPMELEEIERVISHPHAHAQCRRYMRAHLSRAEVVAANSTAEAVRLVSESTEKWAAIGSSLAAKNYGCVVLAADIEDHPDNETRFVILSREAAPQDLPQPYKTSIVCAIERDRPGSLMEILEEFASRDINLTKIESRPSKKGLGDYVFFIDMEGSQESPAVAAALSLLSPRLASMKLLGSYPAG